MENHKLFEEFPPVSVQDWENQIIKDLKGADYEKKLVWKSPEGITVKPYYTRQDLVSKVDGAAGAYPYQRGYQPGGNQWKIVQNIDNTILADANAMAAEALDKGADAVSFSLDYINEQEELAFLLKGIDLEEKDIHFVSFHSYSILFDLLMKEVQRRGYDASKISGSFNFDSFSYYLLHGEYYNSMEDNMNELECLLKTIHDSKLNYSVINVNGQHFHNAGATSVQELGFALASAQEYLQIMVDRGMKAEEVISKMRLTLSIGPSYFMEIAKFRAARLLWAKIAAQYGVSEEKAKIRIHAISGLFNKTVYDLQNNMLRNTTEAMSAVLGGADEITILPHDVTIKAADNFSNRIARNVQLLLRNEAHFEKVADVAGGAYYIETLTSDVAAHAWNYFLKADAVGGFVKAMEGGLIREEIEKNAAVKKASIAQRKNTLVGVNNYPNLNERVLASLKKEVSKPAAADNALRLIRGTEEFEIIRLATETYVANGSKQPLVYLNEFGNLAMRKARAMFSTNFFGVAGYTMYEQTDFTEIAKTIKEIVDKKADIAVLCSSDEEYGTTGIEMVKALRAALPGIIIVIAGNPAETADALKAAGADEFIHVRTNLLESLKGFQKKLGVIR